MVKLQIVILIHLLGEDFILFDKIPVSTIELPWRQAFFKAGLLR